VAKGQKRSGREPKKPKQPKNKVAAATSPFSTAARVPPPPRTVATSKKGST